MVQEFELTQLDAATATVEQVAAALIRDGGLVLKGLCTREECGQVEKDIRAYLEKDSKWSGDIFPEESKRVCGMVGKSRTAAERIIGNELYQAVCDYFLSDTISAFWGCGEPTDSVSKPQLNNSIVFSIRPGARNQDLHRDDYIHHNHLTSITAAEYKVGRDANIGLFVAGKPTTKENGATRFIPGSHLWGSDRPPIESMAVHAELDVGDAFIMLGSAYHGGSANNTQNEERLVFSCFMTKGFLRQEENQYLATPIEVVKTYPRRLQEIMGYYVSKPFLGWLDLQDPIKYLGVPVGKDDLI